MIALEPHVCGDDDHDRDDGDDRYAPSLQYGNHKYHSSFSLHPIVPLELCP